MVKIGRKKQDAKAFESALSAESKRTIERILDSIDIHSDFGVNQSILALNRIIGDRAVVFLKNLLSAFNLDDFVKGLGLAPETIKYINYLFAVYGSKLRGVIDESLIETPDSLLSSALIATRYDLDRKEPIIKIAVVKENKETIIIEDYADNLMFLSACIIEHVLKNSSDLARLQKNLGIERSTISRLKKSIEKLDKLTSSAQK